MTEQELREAIAEKLARLDNWDWDQLCDEGRGYEKPLFRRRADEIMSLIKSACWLKGEQKLPTPRSFIHTKSTDKQSLEEIFKEGQMLMLELISDNFKACQEWEKE